MYVYIYIYNIYIININIYIYININILYIYYIYIIYIYIHIYKDIWWEEDDDAKQLYLVLKVSCRQTDNLQPGTTIIQKNLQYSGIFNMTLFM